MYSTPFLYARYGEDHELMSHFLFDMEWALYLAGEMIYNTLSKMKTPKAIFYFISISKSWSKVKEIY